jgi:predicted nucleic acid-binding protein
MVRGGRGDVFRQPRRGALLGDAGPRHAGGRTDDRGRAQRAERHRPDWQLVSAAAAIKAHGGLSYADAFCLATAERLGAPLMTGDPEIIERVTDRSYEVIDLRLSGG